MSKKAGDILVPLLHYTDNADFWEILVESTRHLATKHQKDLIERALNNALMCSSEKELEEAKILFEKAKKFIEED